MGPGQNITHDKGLEQLYGAHKKAFTIQSQSKIQVNETGDHHGYMYILHPAPNKNIITNFYSEPD